MVNFAIQYWNILYQDIKRKSEALAGTDSRKDINHKRSIYDRQHRNQFYFDLYLKFDLKDRIDSQRSRIDLQKNWLGSDDKLIRCFGCNNDEHLRGDPRCPRRTPKYNSRRVLR